MSTTTTITKTSTNQTNAASSTPSPRWTHLFAVLAAIALGATLLPRWTVTTQSAKRPDVVVFVADDLGAGDVGYMHAGGPRAFATPIIDKLARKSLRLTRF